MQGKALDFEHVFDLRAVRVIVDEVAACYAALAACTSAGTPVDGEFDDYIARPKPNGYQSLHTVVLDDAAAADRGADPHARDARPCRARRRRALGLQGGRRQGLRRRPARWPRPSQLAEARKAVLRELLAWERDFSAGDERPGGDGHAAPSDPRIYVFTPQATVIELPAGATPVDFAYAVHTDSATAAAAPGSTARWCR